MTILNSLKDEQIVNFTGISNTDLKLSFGAANLPTLSRFDQNYTLLARALHAQYRQLADLRAEELVEAVAAMPSSGQA